MMKVRSRIAILLPVLMFLASCATETGLYRWYGYDQKLLTYYQKPETADEFRIELETSVNKIEKNGRSVAPGIYAEIGTLYLQKGDSKSAVLWYEKESAAWPESKTLMDALILNLSKSNS